MMRRLALALGLATIAGCAGPQYTYLPAEQATATIAGEPAARYAIPPESPRGAVRVATTGIVELQSRMGGEIRAIQIRMVVANNNGDAPWVLDTREQFLSIAHQGESRAAFVNSNAAVSPEIQIAPGQQRTIDFYYPLPRHLQKASKVPEFDFAWIVHTPERDVAERTPFDRYRVETEYPSERAGFGMGAGSYWYYDRAWPSFGFAQPVVIERPRTYLVPAPEVKRVR